MSKARILDFGTMPEFGNLDFQNLEKCIRQHLMGIKTLPDLEKLIKRMNPLLKAEQFSAEEHTMLRRLRQRAYDRRRHPNFQTIKSEAVPKSKPKIQTPRFLEPNFQTMQLPKSLPEGEISMPTAIVNSTTVSGTQSETFSQGALRALYSINGELFVKTVPKLLAWFSGAALVSFFLWKQSLALYESAGFTDSMWASAGGILMIVGFAAYHSITRSKLALLLCLYANGYEAYLMISGTLENELQIQIQTIQSNPDLVFLKEKAAKSLAHYHELKQRYDNPECKVFKNDWFLKTHLNPAWQESVANHDELVAKELTLTVVNQTDHITWLKIFYRLGLVFLCMMLVHRFFAVWTERYDDRAVE